MSFDTKSAVALATTIALGALAVTALVMGNKELALTLAALLVPSAGQMLHPASDTVTTTP
jgi:hypothetical protein